MIIPSRKCQKTSRSRMELGMKEKREGGGEGGMDRRSEGMRKCTLFLSLSLFSIPCLLLSHVPDELVHMRDPRPGLPQPGRD